MPGRGTAGRRVAGNARFIAAPAYLRLLAAEPLLKRSIPVLILIFLIVVASVRFLSLMTWRDDVERDAKAILNLAAGELANALMLPGAKDAEPDLTHATCLRKAGLLGALGRDHVLAITDGAFKVVAATPRGERLGGQVPRRSLGRRPAAVPVRRPRRRRWRSRSTARTGSLPRT